MNYQQYKNAITQFIPSAKARPDEEILNAINFARKEIANLFDPIIQYKSFNTTANQSEYSLSSILQGSVYTNLNKLLKVTCNINTLSFILQKTFREHISYRTYQGIPLYYYHYNDVLGLFPVPADVYQVEIKFSLLPNDMTSQSQEMQELLPYKELIVYLACEKVAMMVGNAELSIFFRDTFDRVKHMIRTQYK